MRKQKRGWKSRLAFHDPLYYEAESVAFARREYRKRGGAQPGFDNRHTRKRKGKARKSRIFGT